MLELKVKLKGQGQQSKVKVKGRNVIGWTPSEGNSSFLLSLLIFNETSIIPYSCGDYDRMEAETEL